VVSCFQPSLWTFTSLLHNYSATSDSHQGSTPSYLQHTWKVYMCFDRHRQRCKFQFSRQPTACSGCNNTIYFILPLCHWQHSFISSSLPRKLFLSRCLGWRSVRRMKTKLRINFNDSFQKGGQGIINIKQSFNVCCINVSFWLYYCISLHYCTFCCISLSLIYSPRLLSCI